MKTSTRSTPKKNRHGKLITLLSSTAFLSALLLTLTGCGAGGVPEDQVKKDIGLSGFASSGFISSGFVENSPYEIIELNINTQTEGLPTSSDKNRKERKVEFSGKMKNENFESEFIGEAQYFKLNDAWEISSPPTATATSTIPLKGVDLLSTTKSKSENESIEGFESSLDQKNGTYSSVAKQQSKIDEWFASDAITTEQSFTFTSESGWKQSSEPKVIASKTEYKLTGKKFTCTGVPGIYNNEDDVTYTMTLANVTEDGTVTADYSIDYDPLATLGFLNYTFNAIHEAGTATGKIKREVGSPLFSVELNDPSKGVTLQGESTVTVMSAGTGTVNAISANVYTTFAYKNSPEGKAVELTTSNTFTETSK